MNKDIVTYRVSLNSKGGLEFEEILVGVGALCGSTLIDRNFHDWMIKKFGTQYTNVKLEKRNFSSAFFREFEEVKKSFTGPNYKRRMDIYPINMNVSTAENYDQDDRTLHLKV